MIFRLIRRHIRKVWLCGILAAALILPLILYLLMQHITSVIILYYRPKIHKLPNIKYILLWTNIGYTSTILDIEPGSSSFVNNKCEVTNCFLTTNREYFGAGNESLFDAILFHGDNVDVNDLPKTRSPNQVYLFIQMESAVNNPVCRDVYDGFFNRTATYKLDSDLKFIYIKVTDKNGTHVGPRIDMHWVNMTEDYKPVHPSLYFKSKTAAWFVSRCTTQSFRENFANELDEFMSRRGLFIDYFGSCTTMQCPKEHKNVCFMMLEREYFFYLALENSFDEDYVSEKVLNALEHYTVPIVFGTANYSRFLPPGSYINGLDYAFTEEDMMALAARIEKIIKNRKKYLKFFKWRNYYKIENYKNRDRTCSICSGLDTFLNNHKVYKNFRSWWSPDYEELCKNAENINLNVKLSNIVYSVE